MTNPRDERRRHPERLANFAKAKTVPILNLKWGRILNGERCPKINLSCSNGSNPLNLPSSEKPHCLGSPNTVVCPKSMGHRMDQQDELTALKDRNALTGSTKVD